MTPEPTTRCPYCERDIPSRNIMRHVVDCSAAKAARRRTILAPPKREPTDHIFFVVPYQPIAWNSIRRHWEAAKKKKPIITALGEYELTNGILGCIPPDAMAHMRIVIRFPGKRQMPKDHTNLQGYRKVIEDVCVAAGLIKDDDMKHLDETEVLIGGVDKQYPRMEVTIERAVEND